MKESDFENLNMRQEVYYEGNKVVITLLKATQYDDAIEFNNSNYVHNFKDIMKDLSFEKPKKKVKAYLYCKSDGRISDYFYTDNFQYSFDGSNTYSGYGVSSNWDKTEFYIEVAE